METPTTMFDLDSVPPSNGSDLPTLDEFAKHYCSANLGKTVDGRYILTVSCDLSTESGRRQFDRRIDMTPIADFLVDQARAFHDYLHAEQRPAASDALVSGPFAYAIGGAADEGATSLYQQAAPILPFAGPWGLFAAAATTFMRASQGDQTAQAQIRQVGDLARAGNDVAISVARTLGKIQRLFNGQKRPQKKRRDHRSTRETDVTTSGDFDILTGPTPDELDIGSYLHRPDELDIGRLLHIPYRSPLRAVAEGNPGLSLSLRHLYNRGATP